MNKIRLILIGMVLLLTTCTPRHKGTNVDSELYDIYIEFLEDCEDHGINIDEYPRLSNLRKKVMSEETVGICISDETLFYKYRNVYVSESINDDFLLKFIAYHEMGHCIFNLPHDSTDEIRIMTSEINVLNRDKYVEHWDELRYYYFMKIKEGQKSTLGTQSNCNIKLDEKDKN